MEKNDWEDLLSRKTQLRDREYLLPREWKE